MKSAIELSVSKFGSIDILVNNASAMYPYRLEKLEPKRFHLMNDVILRGTFLMSKYCLPYMKQSEKTGSKHILNISPRSPSHHGLVSLYPAGRFGHLAGSAASSVSRHAPSPHEIGGESIWQSSSEPHHLGQNNKT
ncbi:SDR family oxidoreductase [Klebsiella pneumoniae]|nr:SDR family oxidoreductase [Klebsiella pneumoniae]